MLASTADGSVALDDRFACNEPLRFSLASRSRLACSLFVFLVESRSHTHSLFRPHSSRSTVDSHACRIWFREATLFPLHSSLPAARIAAAAHSPSRVHSPLCAARTVPPLLLVARHVGSSPRSVGSLTTAGSTPAAGTSRRQRCRSSRSSRSSRSRCSPLVAEASSRLSAHLQW